MESIKKGINYLNYIFLVFSTIAVFIYIQLVFFNQHENRFLYEKITYAAPHADNILGLHPGEKLRYSVTFFQDPFLLYNGKPMLQVSAQKLLTEERDDIYLINQQRLVFKNSTVNNGVIDVYQLRPFLNYFSALAVSVFCIGMLVLYDVYNQLRKKNKLVPENNPYFSVFLLLIPLVYALLIMYQYPKLGGGQGDSAGYLSMSFDSIEKIAGTVRTPGYPYFLAVMRQFSPMGLYSAYFFQAAIYLGSLSYLIFALWRIGMPRYLGIILFFLFQGYFYDFHSNILADSLGLSGIILLLACSIHLSSCIVQSQKKKSLLLFILLGFICFAQLMIKPFPSTILIVPAVFVCLSFLQMKLRKILLYAILMLFVCSVPAVMYCSYRYYRYDDFNFASMANISLAVQCVATGDESFLVREDISENSRAFVKRLTESFNNSGLGYKWPLAKDDTLRNQVYMLCVNRFWFHSGNENSFKKSGLWNPQYPDCVNVDNCAKPIVKELIRKVPLERRKAVWKSYWKRIIDVEKSTRDTYAGLNILYPFGADNPLWIYLILVPSCSLLAFFIFTFFSPRWRLVFQKAFNGRLLFLLFFIALILPGMFFATCFIIAPFCETRREIIGMWGWFFGWIALALNLCYANLYLLGSWLRMMVRHDNIFFRKHGCRSDKSFLLRYSLDRCLVFLVLGALFICLFDFRPARVSFYINSTHNVKLQAKEDGLFSFLSGNSNTVKANQPPQVITLSPWVKRNAPRLKISLRAPADAKTAIHIIQLDLPGGKYEYVHQAISNSFLPSLREKILSVDSRNGLMISGPLDLTIRESLGNPCDSYQIKWDEKLLKTKLFPNDALPIFFFMLAALGLFVSAKTRTIAIGFRTAFRKLRPHEEKVRS